MKTFPYHIACMLLVVSLFYSCKNDKSETSTSTTTVTETTEYIDGSEQGSSGSGSGDTGSGQSVSTSNQRDAANSSGPASKKKSGYSAADGSAAENRDGDMYTRHDTTPMPSGVPIK